MMEILFVVQLILLLIFFAISFINLLSAPFLRASKQKKENEDFVSILIPARNEEKNISQCLQSVLSLDYQNYEVILLDDESEDRTFEIVESIQKSNPKLKIIKGKTLPEKWSGKNWACHQLATIAKGKYFLFIDADVKLSPNALKSTFSLLGKYNSKVLSVFPTQIVKSFGESLVTPLMNWILLTFLPLILVHKSKNKSFVAANGQFFFIEKDLYFKIGGHEKVKSEIVEDMALARNIKSIEEKMLTALGGNQIFCRMYSDFGEGVRGFSKNFFKGFRLSPALFVLFLIFVEFVFLFPIIFSFVNFLFIYLALIIIISQIVVLLISRQSLFISLLHPIQMIVLFYIGMNSMLSSIYGKLEWKNRKIK